ncbi:MAG TPA: winged helix-turn-helix domain-containing protein [Pyrinomonadaceae bacterium]|nr:winged helix-turn-helix domain-containing protein [Pyrinomonadaceae bacterium]
MNEPKLQIYEFDKFRVDVSKRLLTKGEEQIPLTPKVFDTLLYLIQHGGKVIEKDELMREIWTDSIVEENNLNQNISILRRVFGEKPGEQRFIVTIAGHGYRFVPEVRQVLSSGSGIAELENIQTGSAIEARKTEDQISYDAAQVTNGKNPNQNRKLKIQNPKWLVGFAVLIVLALGASGFYLRSKNDKSIDTPIRTIAVLPFKPLVLENRNEALELGLADTLISKLSGGEEIVVRPLSASRRYSSVEQDSLTAARELSVESVLDGTIQNWGDRIRISAKLLRASDGKQLWAERFDEKFTDIFAVQDVIAEKVAAALKIRLGGNQKKHSTENVEAYQLYMKGRYHLAKGKPPDIRTGISYFQQAIEIDPGYARAYVGLSQAYGVLGIFGEMPPSEAFPKARAAEQKALEIDDTLSEAHAARCMGLFWSDWDWHAAERECLEALKINPNNAESHGYFAIVLSNTGRHIEALAEAKRARELNPLDLGISALEGQYLLHAGRTDEALIQLKKLLELEPNFPMSHLFAASAYIEKGMFDEAIAESRKEYELSGRNDIPFGMYALAKSGKRDEASAALKELLRLSETKYVSPYNIALIYNALDERERAFEWLEKAYERRDPKMTFLKVEPKWNNLRNEPRFIDLMKRMKLQ